MTVFEIKAILSFWIENLHPNKAGDMLSSCLFPPQRRNRLVMLVNVLLITEKHELIYHENMDQYFCSIQSTFSYVQCKRRTYAKSETKSSLHWQNFYELCRFFLSVILHFKNIWQQNYSLPKSHQIFAENRFREYFRRIFVFSCLTKMCRSTLVVKS